MLCLLSYVRVLKPPAGVEPTPRPYKGRVLAVDTTEALMETVGVEPTPPRCKRGALPIELHPQGADCVRDERKVWFDQTAAERQLKLADDGFAGVGHSARDRLSKSNAGKSSWPAQRAGFSAGERRWDSNPRSRAHEARGDSHSPTARKPVAPAKPPRPLVGVASERRSRSRRQSRHDLWSASQASALVCPAGVEPAISGAQSQRGGQSPYRQK